MPRQKASPSTWCDCSAGFEKTLFDNAFGESLEVEVLESVLDGSERCRFAIKLPESVGRKKPLQ
jgi:predicted hydrocarbon binding protein